MAHYAFLDENNIVTDVIVGRDEHEIVNGISDWEEHYGSIRNQICKRTSYNTIAGKHTDGGVPFRKNYAGIGFSYDPIRDAFIPPKPHASWTVDEYSCVWVPPIPQPANTETSFFRWNEETVSWDEISFDGEEFLD